MFSACAFLCMKDALQRGENVSSVELMAEKQKSSHLSDRAEPSETCRSCQLRSGGKVMAVGVATLVVSLDHKMGQLP